MLKIGEKTFMNLQEAVAWLLDNNSIPFQCTANYAANTEIGLGTVVNPTPAKVKIGSLIFFADSKVSTVVGITETGFVCSDKYNNLVDDIAYVSGVAINSSGHLITTMSDGQTIDAGLIKQVSSFSINASQHLIANFNDGSTNDLGAIFTGNVNINGNFTANSIIENMSGYAATLFHDSPTNMPIENVYAGAVKTGNKLTIVGAFYITRLGNQFASLDLNTYLFNLPQAVRDKLYPAFEGSNMLYPINLRAYKSQTNYKDLVALITKHQYGILIKINNPNQELNSLTLNEKYYCRFEATFLLSESLV